MTGTDERRPRGLAGSSPSRPGPPAGWYEDPAGGPSLRWWDGYRWTGRTRPLPSRQSPRRPLPAPAPRRMLRGPAMEPYSDNNHRDNHRARELPFQNGRSRYNGQGYNGQGFDSGAAGYGSRSRIDERDGWPNGHSPATAAGRHAAAPPAMGWLEPASAGRRTGARTIEAGQVNAALVTLGISAAYVVSLLTLAGGYLLGSSGLRLIGVLGAIFFGVGAAPLQFSGRTSLSLRLAVAGITGLAAITVGATVMVIATGWHPLRLALVIGLLATIPHVIGCRNAAETIWESGAAWPQRFNLRSAMSLSLACTALGTLLWFAAALSLGHVVPGVLGFLPKISVLWYLGLVLLIAAIVLARHKPETHAMLALVSLVSAVTLTPAMAYGTPRSQAAGKHIDLVQQILLIHFLNPRDGIYEAYSGFFSGIAWVCTLAHIPNSVTLAAYWPFIVGLLGLAELRFLFGRFGFSRYRIWAAMTLAVLVNAVGSDYFSPQSVGFVFALGVFGLAVGDVWPGLSDRMRVTLLLFAGWGLAVTHELSPYLAGGVLVVLVVVAAARPWYVPATILVPALIWVTVNWYVVKGYVSFANFLSLANYTPPKLSATPGLSRLPIVSESSYAMLLGLLALIALAGVGFARTIRENTSWGYAISAGMGLVLITFNSYGNEGIFRAALFGIPWLAILALIGLPRQLPRWAPAAFGIASTVLVATFLVSEFGLDNSSVIRSSDLAALNYYQSHAAPNSDLLNLTFGNIPVSVTFPPRGHNIILSKVISADELRPSGADAADAASLARSYISKYSGRKGSAATDQLYAIWSPAAAQYSVDYGLETLAQAQSWRHQLVKSPHWKLVFSSDGTDLFHVVIPRAGHQH